MFTYDLTGGGGGGAETLGELTDLMLPANREWPGPYTITYGAAAPTAGTGTVGSYYVDTTNALTPTLYGPKQEDNSWPSIGLLNTTWARSFNPPSGNSANGLNHNVQVSGTGVPLAYWGPYNANGLSERSVLSYNNETLKWEAANNEVVLANYGGNHAAQTQSISGVFSVNSYHGNFFLYTLTGNVNFSVTGFVRPKLFTERASSIYLCIKQGGTGSYTVTWPSSVKWKAATAPTLSTTVGAVDIIQLISFDNGTTWLASVIEQDIRS